MAEYIEREAAIAEMQNTEHDLMADYGPEYGSEWGISTERAVETIKSVPAADVAPVVHGKWVVGGVHGNGVIGNWKCDICKGVSLKETLYCPYCGAKMTLEE